MPIMESPPGAETLIDGRRYLYFAGTGYLGLQGNPEIIRAACVAVERYGLGSATSRGGFGDTPPVLDVERQAARFFDTGAAFYFSSGFVGAEILLGSLRSRCDALFMDECAHYALSEAARHSGLPLYTFSHCDVDALHDALRAHSAGCRPAILTDGVFSALGHIAPLAEYRDLLRISPARCSWSTTLTELGSWAPGEGEHWNTPASGPRNRATSE